MYRWSSILTVLIACTSAMAGPADDARETRKAAILQRCEQLFGPRYDIPKAQRRATEGDFGGKHGVIFQFSGPFVVLVTLLPSGALGEITLEPTFFLEDREHADAEEQLELSSVDEADFLSKAESLQPLGELVHKGEGTFHSGPGDSSVDGYEHGRVHRFWRDVLVHESTHEWRRPLQKITVAYERAITGIVQKKETSTLFGSRRYYITVNGESYPITPEAFAAIKKGSKVLVHIIGCFDGASGCQTLGVTPAR